MSTRSRRPLLLQSDPASTRRRPRGLHLGICVALLLTTAAVYAPVRHFAFLNMDDPEYVWQNPHITAGLTRASVIWAWTRVHGAEYHPLTTLSHMLACELFGLNPGPHHLINVALHVVGTLLLFGVFTDMTGQSWRSAAVAALFALHPAHVESVAWVAQRKDEMCLCFWMLTLWAYLAYARRSDGRRYALLLIAYLGAVLSKPIAITLPFVLLLLDVWPLHRTPWEAHLPGDSGGVASHTPLARVAWRTLLVEKLPLLLLAGMLAVITYITQRDWGSLNPQLTAPFPARAANALVAYGAYLGELIYPVNLGVFYPFNWPLPTGEVVGAALLLMGISAFVLWGTRRHPYLFTGWLWYAGTLLPVIGLIQYNSQAMADHYTYFPSIGIFIIVAWGLPDLLGRWSYAPAAGFAAAGIALVACTVLTVRQLTYWVGSVPLFEHTLAVTHDNLMMHSVLGTMWVDSKDHRDAALAHLSEAARLCDTRYGGRALCSQAHYNVATLLARRGDRGGAQQHYLAALRLDPGYARAHLGLGLVLASSGTLDAAVEHYQEAIRLDPGLASAHTNLAIALETRGQIDAAITHYAEGVRLEPQNAGFRCNLAGALASA